MQLQKRIPTPIALFILVAATAVSAQWSEDLYTRDAEANDFDEVYFTDLIYKRNAEPNDFDEIDFTDLLHKRDAEPNDFEEFDFTDLLYRRDAEPNDFDEIDFTDLLHKREPEPEPEAVAEAEAEAEPFLGFGHKKAGKENGCCLLKGVGHMWCQGNPKWGGSGGSATCDKKKPGDK